MPEKLESTPKVLIVSNRQTTGPLWVFSLQQQKLNVVLEPNPAGTLRRWEKEIPDLILIDLHLPEVSTLELIKTLRAETLTPILLLAPAGGEESMLEAYQAGVDEYLIKPVSPSLLQAKIKVWLRYPGDANHDPSSSGTTFAITGTSSVPMCNGRTATIYVNAQGRIVGGPDNGKVYKGQLKGTDHQDVIVGSTRSDVIDAKGGNDVVCGGNGNDKIYGGTGNDRLFGDAGMDELNGDGHNDILTGGTNADKFNGGVGNDSATDFNPAKGDTKTSVEHY